jgi:hypothetical protein
MFSEVTDSTTLRQGDVIAGIYFPLSRLDTLPRLAGTFVSGSGKDVGLQGLTEQIGRSWYLSAQLPAIRAFCAVLGQDCDVAATQNPPPHTVVLCRILPVPESIRRNPDYYRALRENLDPYGHDRPFFGFFYLGHDAAFGSNEEFVADYGQVTTVPWKDYHWILKNKIAQLDDLNRAKFRVKAGAYFGRTPEEDKAIGLEDPWAPTGN